MAENGYLRWAIESTRTKWWHDSAEPSELDRGLAHGAVGVTTNPLLCARSLGANSGRWSEDIRAVLAGHGDRERRAEELMRVVVVRAAEKLLPEYRRSGGAMGYVCAQVNPARQGEREAMREMARRYSGWAPNIAVKLPATAAGLDVLEDCIADGITVTATVSFTVPQVIAIAERYRLGVARARAKPGKCFAVIMIGRLDDYLRDVARDRRAGLSEADIRQSGVAVTKRAYALYRERGYEAVLIVAALRGPHHMTEIAGADLVMSIAPEHQDALISGGFPREERIGEPVPRETIERLSGLPEFVRAYEPDGMEPREFIAYGVSQRTLTQFSEAGWNVLERFGP